MKGATPIAVAALLKGLRVVFREHAAATGHQIGHPPMVAAEALLWIASGVDHAADLAEAMGTDRSTANRTISLLRGRARWRQGRSVLSPFGLVEVRNHPHRPGHQLILSENGQDLLDSTFAPHLHHCSTSNRRKP